MTMPQALLSPVRVGELDLASRVVMAPLTRSRSRQPGDIPWALNAEYYAQRADPRTGAALIISEATQISPQGKGYAFTPGIHTHEQVQGWRLVTDAVHAKGGLIALQLWHVGRISHTDLQPDHADPVAPSALRASAMTYTSAASGMVPTSTPRALSAAEIPAIVTQYHAAALRAKQAGFDAIEIHGANGYLLDQFTRSGTNRRDDAYGGTIENRCRLPLEVAHAVVDVWGPGRVGYRISPLGAFNDMHDHTPAQTFAHLAEQLGAMGLAFIHVVEEFGPTGRDAASEALFTAVRDAFRRRHPNADRAVYLANGGYTAQPADARIRSGLAEAVAFGKLFISNPDLTDRFRRSAPLNPWDQATFYGGSEVGYTDYPTLDHAPAALTTRAT